MMKQRLNLTRIFVILYYTDDVKKKHLAYKLTNLLVDILQCSTTRLKRQFIQARARTELVVDGF